MTYTPLELKRQKSSQTTNGDYCKYNLQGIVCILVSNFDTFVGSLYLINIKSSIPIQARIAQLVAYWLGTGAGPGFKSRQGREFFSEKSN